MMTERDASAGHTFVESRKQSAVAKEMKKRWYMCEMIL